MSKVNLTIGVPGSGKSTLARQYEQNGWVVVERDRIRMELFGSWYPGNQHEGVVTYTQRNRIAAAIRDRNDVFVSDTNINPKSREELIKFCTALGAEVSTIHVGGGLLFDDLITRNGNRDDQSKVVPYDVMKTMYASYRDQFPLMAPQYDANKPNAFVFDIDGTLANMDGVRGPFDWKKVGLDTTYDDVIQMARDLHNAGYAILVVSGRDGICYGETNNWLNANGVPFDELFMRNIASTLKDSAVKHDIFHRHIAPRYNVRGVFDDRDQVVAAWRSMGVRCYQVQPGSF